MNVKKCLFLILFVMIGMLSTKAQAMISEDEIMSAERGNAKAQYTLGQRYLNGQVALKKNYAEAVKWYKKAADQGYADAQCALGWCYEKGQGVTQNDKQALKYYKLAAEQGNTVAIGWLKYAAMLGCIEAQNSLGELYKTGKGVPQNDEQAIKWFGLAAERGYAASQYNLGWYCEKTHKYVDAVKWYKKAADQGYTYARSALEYCYAIRRGVPKNAKEAFEYYKQAANKGHAYARFNLGKCYELGQGVKQDPIEAAKWFRLAAEQNYVVAQVGLGLCYFAGYGVTKDYVEAIKWFKLAAEQENAEAQFLLGICYDNGQGVTKDYVESAKWYRKSAELGNIDAQFNLGWCYANGKGVEQSYEEAIKWYRSSAEHGIAEAQYSLGVYYANGQGVEQNYAEACKWYKKAAKQGHAKSQYYLGVRYINGQGVKQSDTEAVKWFKLAAHKGNVDAQMELGWCYYYARGVKKDLAEAAKWFYQHNLSMSKDKDDIPLQIDPVDRICGLFNELEKVISPTQVALDFITVYFSDHFSRLTDFLEKNGINAFQDKMIIQKQIVSRAIDMCELNKFLTEAYDALKCAKFVLAYADYWDNEDVLAKILEILSAKDFCVSTAKNSDVILTDSFLSAYVISPWRSCVVPYEDIDVYGILANIFGAGFSSNLVHCEDVSIGENIYDYIFGDKGRFTHRFADLCEKDGERVRDLLAREMYWLRRMKEKYDTESFTEEKRKIYDKCRNLVETHFVSATGACKNELADVMIMWAADIDECEDAMGTGVKIYDQKTFDERFTTLYRQSLVEKVLSNDYIENLMQKTEVPERIKHLHRMLNSCYGPECRNFYRFLVARLLNVIPVVGLNFFIDNEITGQDMIDTVSEAVNLNDMCKMVQDMYQNLADEKDAQVTESIDLSVAAEEKTIKEKLVIDIESSYKVSFEEFCIVVDKTCAGEFKQRIQDFLSCELKNMDESTEQIIDDMREWISGKKLFTVSELVNMVFNIDLTYIHTENIPELTRFSSTIGGRGEKSAQYYAKVLYPIHLLKAGFIKLR